MTEKQGRASKNRPGSTEAENPFVTAARIQDTLLTSGGVPELPRWEPDDLGWLKR